MVPTKVDPVSRSGKATSLCEPWETETTLSRGKKTEGVLKPHRKISPWVPRLSLRGMGESGRGGSGEGKWSIKDRRGARKKENSTASHPGEHLRKLKTKRTGTFMGRSFIGGEERPDNPLLSMGSNYPSDKQSREK